MMKPTLTVVAVLAAALICSTAGAQRRGGGFSGGISSARMAPASRPSFSTAAPFAAPRAASRFGGVRLMPNGQAIPRFSTLANSTKFSSLNRVAAFGFGSPYSPAPSSGGLRGSLPGNVGRDRRNRYPFVPFVLGGYPFYYGDDYYDPSYDGLYNGYDPSYYAQMPLPLDQQLPAGYAAQQDVAPANYAGASSTVTPASDPVPDVGEFVLVRRDGGVLFASAFSVTGDQLRYITPEGIRRTIPMADLDASATQQMNEARGTTIQLHN